MGKRPVANDDDEVVTKRGDPGQMWWVDDEGAWHLVDTESPEAYLSCPIGQSREQQGFAFRDLGFMKINTAEGHLDIQWDVSKVAPAAVDSVLCYLDGTDQTKPVSLSFFYEGWNREIQQSQQAAMDRIGQAQAYRGVELLNSVMLHRHDLDEVNQNCNLIRHGFRAWQESGGAPEIGPASSLAQGVPVGISGLSASTVAFVGHDVTFSTAHKQDIQRHLEKHGTRYPGGRYSKGTLHILG